MSIYVNESISFCFYRLSLWVARLETSKKYKDVKPLKTFIKEGFLVFSSSYIAYWLYDQMNSESSLNFFDNPYMFFGLRKLFSFTGYLFNSP